MPMPCVCRQRHDEKHLEVLNLVGVEARALCPAHAGLVLLITVRIIARLQNSLHQEKRRVRQEKLYRKENVSMHTPAINFHLTFWIFDLVGVAFLGGLSLRVSEFSVALGGGAAGMRLRPDD